MEIPNLAKAPSSNLSSNHSFPVLILVGIVTVGLTAGFWLSRFFPSSKTTAETMDNSIVTSTDSVESSDQIVAGKVYGNLEKVFKDSAIGTIEKGSINGEGTHILNREGGSTQRASLTSSAVDLDLFVDKKVEIKGETNASTKTAWLLDVGNIKVLP